MNTNLPSEKNFCNGAFMYYQSQYPESYYKLNSCGNVNFYGQNASAFHGPNTSSFQNIQNDYSFYSGMQRPLINNIPAHLRTPVSPKKVEDPKPNSWSLNDQPKIDVPKLSQNLPTQSLSSIDFTPSIPTQINALDPHITDILFECPNWTLPSTEENVNLPSPLEQTVIPNSRRSSKCECLHCRKIPKPTTEEVRKKKYPCQIIGCNKTYGKSSHLKAHLLWHAGERPHKCHFISCGKAFTRKDELQRHMRTHTGERKFLCIDCNKSFIRSDHLSKHRKIHRNQQHKQSPSKNPKFLESKENINTIIQDGTLSQSAQYIHLD